MTGRLLLNLSDNLILKVFFFFIPFTYALTFNIGFPLKLSEIALFLIVGLYLFKGKISIQNLKEVKLIVLFCVFAVLSTLINLCWLYPYKLNVYNSRFGFAFDSLFKLFYLLLACAAYLCSIKSFSYNQYKFLKIFLIGSIIAAIYAWYLFLSSFLGIPVLLLPGMDDQPQTVGLSIGTFIRCGTFKEGNYMGLFLLISATIAFYSKKAKSGYFLLFTIITTVSSMGILSGIIFVFLYNFKKLFTKKNLIKLFIFILLFLSIFLALMSNKDFQFLLYSKIFGQTKEISNNAEFSKADRLNSSISALRMGLNNPVFGVGLSNYSLHQKEYNLDDRFFIPNFKSIPNNVYAELFSELGIIGFVLFIVFIYRLFRLTKIYASSALRIGLICTVIYLLAFPTYTMLFLWIFWGLITSLPTISSAKTII